MKKEEVQRRGRRECEKLENDKRGKSLEVNPEEQQKLPPTKGGTQRVLKLWIYVLVCI